MKTLLPVSIFSLPAVLVALLPGFHEFLCFDRAALLEGQIWRLWTGHWVHFSHSHLWWNMAAMVCAATWLERVQPGRLLRFSAIAAPLLSLGLAVIETDMAIYGGLSGVGTGVIALLGFSLISSQKSVSDHRVGIGVLVLVIAKLSHDTISTSALLSNFDNPEIQTAPTAHLLGALLALGYHLLIPPQRSANNGSMTALMSSTSSGSIAR